MDLIASQPASYPLAPASPAISVRELSKSFTAPHSRPEVVFRGISFSVQTGHIVGLFGPSGCGKTTLLRILCGVVRYEDGDVAVRNGLGRAGRGRVAYVPQRTELLDWKTLWDNALLGWRIMKKYPPDESEIKPRANDLFERFNLTEEAQKYAQECSGGQRQRAALIRALLTPVDILLLDEPVAAIDHITRSRIYEKLLNIVEDHEPGAQGKTVLMVSHDPEELLQLCDEILVMPQMPATKVLAVPVPFARPRQSDLKFTAEFVALKKHLWGLLV